MTAFTDQGRRAIADIAARHNVSAQAVESLAHAVAAGGGNQAQFSHPELGGMGQWSRGGMTMVGDMFNNGLKATVNSICSELSSLLSQGGVFEPVQRSNMGYSSQSQSQGGGNFGGSGVSAWFSGGGGGSGWPEELGHPSSVGTQNDLRYAVFPQTRRLAIDHAGRITVYDTGDHTIGGVSQQQSGDRSMTFTSQYGTVRLADLPVVQGSQAGDGGGQAASAASPSAPETQSHPAAPEWSAPQSSDPEPAPEPDPNPEPFPEPQTLPEPMPQRAEPAPAAQPAPPPASSGSAMAGLTSDQIFSALEKLGDLHAKGILTDREFETKKSELLSRL